jgi:hypothetical protein
MDVRVPVSRSLPAAVPITATPAPKPFVLPRMNKLSDSELAALSATAARALLNIGTFSAREVLARVPLEFRAYVPSVMFEANIDVKKRLIRSRYIVPGQVMHARTFQAIRHYRNAEDALWDEFKVVKAAISKEVKGSRKRAHHPHRVDDEDDDDEDEGDDDDREDEGDNDDEHDDGDEDTGTGSEADGNDEEEERCRAGLVDVKGKDDAADGDVDQGEGSDRDGDDASVPMSFTTTNVHVLRPGRFIVAETDDGDAKFWIGQVTRMKPCRRGWKWTSKEKASKMLDDHCKDIKNGKVDRKDVEIKQNDKATRKRVIISVKWYIPEAECSGPEDLAIVKWIVEETVAETITTAEIVMHTFDVCMNDDVSFSLPADVIAFIKTQVLK